MSGAPASAARRTGVEELTRRYEGLRTQLLSGAYRWEHAWGLGTLLRHGMVAWLERGAPWQAPSGLRSAPSPTATPPLAPRHVQLGALIAEMIMPRLEEVTA